MKRLDERLKDMVGHTYMYNTHHYRILSFELNEQLTIVTDRRWFRFPLEDADKALKEFLPVEPEIEISALQVVPKASEMADLKMVLLDNIKRIQNDKEFIQQAHAINKSVTTLVNMARLEMSYLKFIKDNS